MKKILIFAMFPLLLSFTSSVSIDSLGHGSASFFVSFSEQVESYSVFVNDEDEPRINLNGVIDRFEIGDLSASTSYSIYVATQPFDSREDESLSDSLDFSTTSGSAPIYSGIQVSARNNGALANSAPKSGDAYKGGVYIGEVNVSGSLHRLISSNQVDGNIFENQSFLDLESVCSDLVLGGRDDWRLPSLNELKLIQERKSLTNLNTSNSIFWSSSQNQSGERLGVRFTDGAEVFLELDAQQTCEGDPEVCTPEAFDNYPVSCVRSVQSSSTGELQFIIRSEYKSDGTYESETETGTNSFGMSYLQKDTRSQTLKSCIDFEGEIRSYDITLILFGIGDIQTSTLYANGDCQGQAVNCFINNTNPEGVEQRLFEVESGGCDVVIDDFENFGVITQELNLRLEGVSSYPGEDSLFIDEFVITDGQRANITINGVEGEYETSVTYSESIFDQDFFYTSICNTGVYSRRDASILMEGDSESEFVADFTFFEGVCNGIDFSCPTIQLYDPEDMDMGEGFAAPEIRIMDYIGNNQCPANIRAALLDFGSIVLPTSTYGTAFYNDIGFGSFHINPTENEFNNQPVSIAKSFVEDSVRFCKYNGLTTIREVTGTEIDYHIETIEGNCERVNDISCHIITDNSTGQKALYEINRGGCVAIKDRFISNTPLYFDKNLSLTPITSSTLQHVEVIESQFIDLLFSDTEDILNITGISQDESASVNLRMCNHFNGSRVETIYNNNLDPLIVKDYSGFCDGNNINCSVVNFDGETFLANSTGNLNECGFFIDDILNYGEIEGEAGSSLPIEEVIDIVSLEQFNLTSQVLTAGLNNVTKEPLDGSDWEVIHSAPFAGNCNAFPEHVHNDGDQIEVVNDYLPTNFDNCDTANYLEDTSNQIEWSNLGLVRDASFGDEVIVCGINQSCNIDMQVSQSTSVFSNLTPQQGVDGTSAGRGIVFIYDLVNVSADNSRGIGGPGGQADLPISPVDTKYCVNLKDLDNEGAGSVYASNPSLSIREITWEPFREGPNAPPGVSPDSEDERSYIYKGMSDGMMNYLRRDNIRSGEDWD